MKVAAVIAEYNPFHTGHQYHLSKTRELTGADYILVIMSGNFVQRGAPALLNKYTRTRMALLGGADVVIELPTLYAVSSAEYFAQGAVALAGRLGIVDILSFGSESGSVEAFTRAASMLLSCENESASLLRPMLREGLSYPAAKEKLFKEQLSFCKDTENLLTLPNNILGVEYCRALFSQKSSIAPFTIPRQGNNFHDTGFQDSSAAFISAAAIRNFVKSCPCGSSDSETCAKNFEKISGYLPSESQDLFNDAINAGSFLVEDDLSEMLYYKLLCEMEQGFSMYLDCTPDISDKIVKYLPEYTGYTDFCCLLKSKDLTYARISRVLLHILLDIKTPDFYKDNYGERKYFLPYGRLLGFRKSASPLLSSLKKNSRIPLITKLADAKKSFTGYALDFLKKELFCASIYETVSASKVNKMLHASSQTQKKTALNEFRQSPVIVP